MKRPLKIAVVGCGSAGPAVAIFLARAGHDVVLFERALELKPVGAGFMIQPTGQTVLGHLGILGVLEESGATLVGLQAHTRSGRALLDLSYAELGPRVHGLGVQRRLLLHLLCEAMQDAGVELRLGAELISVNDDCLGFSDGSESGPYDLIIGADGSRSKMRECLPLKCKATAYPWGALWFMADDEEAAPYLDQVVHGSREMFGLLPSGCGSAGASARTSMFWSIRCSDYEVWKSRGIEAWKAQVCTLIPRAGRLLHKIDSCEQLTLARYWDVRMPTCCHGNAVLIGDAAHATSPQLGQGVNLGLWDAMALAKAVEAEASVPQALKAYEAERKHPLAYYQWATRFLTPFFQSNASSLALLRDIVMPVANWVGPIRREMVATMAGVKRGFVRSSLTLPKYAAPKALRGSIGN